jgi:hypothetical protein
MASLLASSIHHYAPDKWADLVARGRYWRNSLCNWNLRRHGDCCADHGIVLAQRKSVGSPMKLFAVIYLKGHLASAMFLWPGATIQDCEQINSQWTAELPSTPGIKSGLVQLSDVRMACEWHNENPVKE